MFCYSSIDRRGQVRTDVSAIRELWESVDSRTLLWHEGQFIMHGKQPGLYPFAQLQGVSGFMDEPVYLGRYQGLDYFACKIHQQQGPFEENDYLNLRQASRLVDDHHLGLMFYAQGVLNWSHNHAFCSRCGSETTIINVGHARQCKNRGCAKVLYPKIDPAVIFSIINNKEAEPKILLGRQKAWDEYRYSVIAGFVEPGETLEQAVKREALEETGLKVNNIEYVASQPWPFPDSLMLGFSAECSEQRITLVDQELEKAEWFSAQEIEKRIKSGRLKMPFEVSISWHLINRWFNEQAGYSLESFLSVNN